jgi:hypothetical protein
MKHVVTGALLVCCFAAHGQTMYRCGNTFSQQPCSSDAAKIEVKPAAGASTMKPTGDKQQSEAARIELNIAKSQTERRTRELRDVFIPGAEQERANHQDSCKEKQARLRADQYKYQQNLYGKTHAAQMASEIAALATSCDQKDRELGENLEKLKKELATVGKK